MPFDPDQPLDPTDIARHEFSASFRGYDTEEVRDFLRLLSERVRGDQMGRLAQERDAKRLAELLEERAGMIAKIEALQAELDAAGQERSAAILRAEKAEAAADPTTWDEARIDALVGEETAHVLEAARTAAAGIRSRAEADAEARIKVAEERQRTTEAEIAELRRQTDADVAALRTEAEEYATALRADAETAAEQLRAESEASAQEVRTAADRDAAERERTATEEAERLRSEALAAAEASREEAEADVVAARERAKEETRLMLTEAQSMREKVLADLVKRRRTGRMQLDQIKAARDRMARSLALVRRDLDEAIDELAAAVPEAKAAMEEVGRSAQAIPDTQAILDLASELDRERMRDAVGADEDSGQTATEEPAGRGAGGEDDAEVVGDALQPEATAEDAEPESDAPDQGMPEEGADFSDDEVEGEAGSGPRVDKVDALFAEMRGRSAVVDDRDVDGEAENESEASDDGTVVPEIFVARDVAMTRFGPDLRRQLKRVLADDQSDVLDRVTRAKKKVGVDDLPPIERQVLAYIDAVTDSIHGAAKAGADAVDGRLDPDAVTTLVETLAREIATPLRVRIERSIEAADGDQDEVIEPIRANYRDARSSEVPGLADDALAEAFALGVYAAIPKGSRVVWFVDPREDPSPACRENAAAGAVKKPAAFPSGRQLPLGGPGCRCIVVTKDRAG